MTNNRTRVLWISGRPANQGKTSFSEVFEWCAREIAVGYGYASGQEATAHIGLANMKTVDVEVLLPHGKGRIERKGVKANQRLTIEK